MGLKQIESQYDFIQHCRDNAATLSEHDWYAMITNLVPFQGGIARVHELSKDYPTYTVQETDNKIAHFQKSGTGPLKIILRNTILQEYIIGYIVSQLYTLLKKGNL